MKSLILILLSSLLVVIAACDDDCPYQNDGVCDDSAGTGSCEDGTDEDDCSTDVCRTGVNGCEDQSFYSCNASPICYRAKTACLESGYCAGSGNTGSGSSGNTGSGGSGNTGSGTSDTDRGGACFYDVQGGIQCEVVWDATKCPYGKYFVNTYCNQVSCGDNSSYRNCQRN